MALDIAAAATLQKAQLDRLSSSVVRIAGFGGMAPRMEAHVLPLGMAQEAINCKFQAGSLDAFYAPELIGSTTNGKTADFYHFVTSDGVEHVAGFDHPTDVVRAPLINDAYDRIYYTNKYGAYITTRTGLAAGNVPAAVLGVPAPDVASFAVTASGGTTATATTRVYVLTQQSPYGEESAPTATKLVTGNGDGTWTITGLNSYVQPGSGYQTMETLNVYRSVTTNTGAALFKVAAFPINSLPTTYTDAMTDDVASEQLQLISGVWNVPPTGLNGLLSHPSGFLVGFVGRTVYFSVPYYPHAWPDSYQLAVEDDIVGLGLVNSTIVVCTKGRPYRIFGTTPGQLSLQKLSMSIPCLSKRGIVSMGSAVYFPTYDGLMAISEQEAGIATAAFMTRDQWHADYAPGSLVADTYEGRYYGFYGPNNGFIFDPSDAHTGWSLIEYNNVANVRQSYVSGQLLLLVGSSAYQWDSDVTKKLNYTWHSSKMLFKHPTNMGVLQLRGDFGRSAFPQPVSYDLWADDTVRASYTVGSENAVRLPAGYKAATYELVLTGRQQIYSAVLASTANQLARVA